MELTSASASAIRFHPIFHTQSPPFFLSSSLSTPSYKSSPSNSTVSTSTTTLRRESQFVPNNNVNNKTQKKYFSVSQTARQTAIRDLQESPDLDSALARSGGSLKVQDLNIILRHFGNSKKWKQLSQLFDWMKRNGRINTSSYSSYIKFMAKGLNPVKALEIYNNIEDESTRNNVSICNSVLSCVVQNGKFEASIRLFHQMKQGGLEPDVVTYSTLLAGCIKVENGYSKAMELVQELKSKELQTDGIMYGTLLAVCASHNKCEEAESYFKQMTNEGQSPNVYHYSSLLNAYSAGGDYKKADSLVQDMKNAGLVPNKFILTTLLKVYVRGGLFDKSRELLSELEALGYAEDEMPYCLLMDALAKAGQLEEAKSVFDEMKKKNVKSDGYSHSIMISALCRSRLFEEAKQLASDFEASSNKYDLVVMNTMLCAYCRAGEMELVMSMLKKMDELAISPDRNTFHILIKYFSREKLYNLAYRTMEDMHRKGYEPDEGLCSTLIFHLGQNRGQAEAFSVYNMLRYSKRTMCKALHEKILHILIAGRLLKDAYVVVKDNDKLISQPAKRKFLTSFLKWGNINMINDVIKVMHSSGYKFDKEVFELAVTRYIAQPEKKELLLQLLRWMPGQGYVLDPTTRNLVLKNSSLFGRQLVAEILSKQHMLSKTLKSHESNEN